MQLHNITRTHKNKKAKQVGRGGKRGTYSGRGIKGQNARAGHKKRPELRDIIKKIPKLRGYQAAQVYDKPLVLNLGSLEKHFTNGESVNPKMLLSKKLVSLEGGRMPKIKILGSGTFSKKLQFSELTISHSAKSKIETAGGSVK